MNFRPNRAVFVLLSLSFNICIWAMHNSTFVYIAGIEGTGHHAVLPILQTIAKYSGFYKSKYDDQPFQSCTWKIHVPKRLQEHLGRIIESDRKENGASVLIEYSSFPFRSLNRDSNLAKIKLDNHYNMEWVLNTVNATEFKMKVLHIDRDFVDVVKSHSELDHDPDRHGKVMSKFQKHLFLEYKRTENIRPNLWKSINIFQLFSNLDDCPVVVQQLTKFLEWNIEPNNLVLCCEEIVTKVWRKPTPRNITAADRAVAAKYNYVHYAWPYMIPPKVEVGALISDVSQVSDEPYPADPNLQEMEATAAAVVTTQTAATQTADNTQPDKTHRPPHVENESDTPTTSTATTGAAVGTATASVPTTGSLAELASLLSSTSEPKMTSVQTEIMKIYLTRHVSTTHHTKLHTVNSGNTNSVDPTDRYVAVEEIYIPSWNIAYNKHGNQMNIILHPPASRYTTAVPPAHHSNSASQTLSFEDKTADRKPKKLGMKLIEGQEFELLRVLVLNKIHYETALAAYMEINTW